jgi:hypothetical protein
MADKPRLVGSTHVAILAAKWTVSTSKLLAPTAADPTKDIAKRHHSDNPVRNEAASAVICWVNLPPCQPLSSRCVCLHALLVLPVDDIRAV